MLPHPHVALDWGTLKSDYTDEFGRVAPDVYAAAGRLWRQAQNYAGDVLHDTDPARVRTLLLKSAAQVTRVRDEKSQQISELDGYLFKTFKRGVCDELEKDGNRRCYETEAHLYAEMRGQVDNVERRILLNEIVAQMDEWTRSVYQWRTLGYNFDEIGRHVGLSEKAVSNKYQRRTESLMKHFKERAKSEE